eukprot:2148450-Rhodomonas_salina.2
MTFQYGQWEINNAECVQKMDAKLEAMHLVQLAMVRSALPSIWGKCMPTGTCSSLSAIPLALVSSAADRKYARGAVGALLLPGCIHGKQATKVRIEQKLLRVLLPLALTLFPWSNGRCCSIAHSLRTPRNVALITMTAIS